MMTSTKMGIVRGAESGRVSASDVKGERHIDEGWGHARAATEP